MPLVYSFFGVVKAKQQSKTDVTMEKQTIYQFKVEIYQEKNLILLL